MDRRLSDTRIFKIIRELPGWWQVLVSIVVAVYAYGIMQNTVQANCVLDEKQQTSIDILQVKVAKLEQAFISISESSASMSKDVREIRDVIIKSNATRR